MIAEAALARSFLERHPRDAVRLIHRANAAGAASLVSSCSVEKTALLLRHMDPQDARAVLVRLPVERTAEILPELPRGLAGVLLRGLAAADRDRVLAAAPKALARSLRLALEHRPDTAGALMDPAVLAVPAEITVGEARRRVRRYSPQAAYYLYVVDDRHRPIGVVNLRELMVASPRPTVASMMRAPVVRVPVHAGVERILSHPGWRELHALPVVDAYDTLVGILRHELLEELRGRAAGPTAGSGSGLGLGLVELMWTLTTAVVDEVVRALEPREAGRPRARGAR